MKENDMQPDPLLEDILLRAMNEPIVLEPTLGWADVQRRAHAHDPLRARLPRLQALRPRTNTTKQRWGFRASLAAGVALAAAAAVLFVPGNHPTILQRAAAAIKGDGPVIHVVWSDDLSLATLAPVTLDVQTGATAPAPPYPAEAWYDTKTHAFKETDRYLNGHDESVWSNGKISVDSTVGVGPAQVAKIPALVEFFGRYEQALQNGDATLDGTGSVDGHDVYFLIVDLKQPIYPTGSSTPIPQSDWVERVAIDQQTYEPVTWYINRDGDPDGGIGHVQKVELIARNRADFTRPAVTWPAVPRDKWGFDQVRSSEQVDRDAAAAWLGQPLVGAPDSLAGQPFAGARAEILSPAGDPERRGVMLVYGDGCNALPRANSTYVVVREAPQQEPTYDTMFAPEGPQVLVQRAASDFPLCDGSVVVDGGSAAGTFLGQAIPDDSLSRTSFRKDGLWISIAASSRDLAIAAAKQVLGS
jgi:hypothetical protein